MYFNRHKSKRVVIGTLCKGKYFSENDAYKSRPSSLSVKCSSIKGELYRIKAKDFLSYIKREAEAWK